MHDLTGFQRDALYVVAGLDAPKGTAIKAILEEHYGREINYGQLYPNLDTLVKKGLVSKGKKDGRTNEYELTSRGESALEAREAWVAELLD